MIAICTAFSQSLVAVEEKEKKDYTVLDSNAKQSENLLVAVDALLEKNNINIGDIKEYAIVVGPGSFTGLRIGIALVKGLCAGSDGCKTLPISSLDLLAYEYVKKNKPADDFVCVLNALSGLYFVAKYDKNGNKQTQESLVDGEGLSKFANLKKIGMREDNIDDKIDTTVTLSAQGLLEFAKQKKESEKPVDYKKLTPVYLRKSQAEVSLEQKNIKSKKSI